MEEPDTECTIKKRLTANFEIKNADLEGPGLPISGGNRKCTSIDLTRVLHQCACRSKSFQQLLTKI